MKARIVYNGHEYASADAMPDEVRREYEAVLAHLADTDRDGIPDVMQQGEHGPRDGAGSTISIQSSSITFDGQHLASSGAMSPFVRRVVEEMGTSARTPRGGAPESSLERVSRSLELFLGALLGVGAAVVVAVAVAMIVTMEASSRSQGGRLYVAVAAIAVLAALDTQAARLVRRRWGASGLFGTSAQSRRFSLFSMAFLVLAAALLFGLALLLP